MAYIYIDIAKTKSLIGDQYRMASELRGISDRIANMRKNVDTEFGQGRIIKIALDRFKEQTQEEANIYTNMAKQLDEIAILYQRTENKVAENSDLNKKGIRIDGYKDSETKADYINKIEQIINETNEEDNFVDLIKKILKGQKKFGNDSEAGVLAEIISYFEDAKKFFMGDKKGITGASNLCKLADSSLSVWTQLYEYFGDKFQGLEKGFFGDIARKNVKVLSLSAGVLGLTSSLLSASKNLDEKKWQSIVANYVDCGKDIFSVIKSGYSLKHIQDAKSFLMNIKEKNLLTEKKGPWSALDLYMATGEGITKAVSQGLRSHEKYMADGQWALEDTGATGIDLSIAGIYGMSHSLSAGLDDVIYSTVDRWTGGNGNSDMSYYEKSAEGWKIMANKCGENIAKWWNKKG